MQRAETLLSPGVCLKKKLFKKSKDVTEVKDEVLCSMGETESTDVNNSQCGEWIIY